MLIYVDIYYIISTHSYVSTSTDSATTKQPIYIKRWKLSEVPPNSSIILQYDAFPKNYNLVSFIEYSTAFQTVYRRWP